jgi:phage shock protein PspC (stress-responsive transcriptional regulator)
LIPDDAGGGRAALLSHRSQSEYREKTVNDVHDTFRRQGLVRPREGRVLGGVIAGLGRRFGIDPWPARLLFTLILMVIPGSQLLIYPVLWILMPNEESAEAAVVTAQPQPPAVS